MKIDSEAGFAPTLHHKGDPRDESGTASASSATVATPLTTDPAAAAAASPDSPASNIVPGTPELAARGSRRVGNPSPSSPLSGVSGSRRILASEFITEEGGEASALAPTDAASIAASIAAANSPAASAASATPVRVPRPVESSLGDSPWEDVVQPVQPGSSKTAVTRAHKAADKQSTEATEEGEEESFKQAVRATRESRASVGNTPSSRSAGSSPVHPASLPTAVPAAAPAPASASGSAPAPAAPASPSRSSASPSLAGQSEQEHRKRSLSFGLSHIRSAAAAAAGSILTPRGTPKGGSGKDAAAAAAAAGVAGGEGAPAGAPQSTTSAQSPASGRAGQIQERTLLKQSKEQAPAAAVAIGGGEVPEWEEEGSEEGEGGYVEQLQGNTPSASELQAHQQQQPQQRQQPTAGTGSAAAAPGPFMPRRHEMLVDMPVPGLSDVDVPYRRYFQAPDDTPPQQKQQQQQHASATPAAATPPVASRRYEMLVDMPVPPVVASLEPTEAEIKHYAESGVTWSGPAGKADAGGGGAGQQQQQQRQGLQQQQRRRSQEEEEDEDSFVPVEAPYAHGAWASGCAAEKLESSGSNSSYVGGAGSGTAGNGSGASAGGSGAAKSGNRAGERDPEAHGGSRASQEARGGGAGGRAGDRAGGRGGERSAGDFSPWLHACRLHLSHKLGSGDFGDTWQGVVLHSLPRHALSLSAPPAEQLALPGAARAAAAVGSKERLEKLVMALRGCEDALGGRLHLATCMDKVAVVSPLFDKSIADMMHKLPGNRLPFHLFLRYGAAVCRAVQQLHEQGVLALNLRPSNFLLPSFHEDVVFLAPPGLPWALADMHADPFSPIPELAAAAGGANSSPVWAGVPAYMAPEQWAAAVNGPLVEGTDAWGFACAALHMISGVSPCNNMSLEQIHDVITAHAPHNRHHCRHHRRMADHCKRFPPTSTPSSSSPALSSPPAPSSLPACVSAAHLAALQQLPLELEAVLLRCFHSDPYKRPSFHTLLRAFTRPTSQYLPGDWVRVPASPSTPPHKQQQQQRVGVVSAVRAGEAVVAVQLCDKRPGDLVAYPCKNVLGIVEEPFQCGDRVRIKRGVGNPRFGWRGNSRSSEGVVTVVDSSDGMLGVRVDLPSSSSSSPSPSSSSPSSSSTPSTALWRVDPAEAERVTHGIAVGDWVHILTPDAVALISSTRRVAAARAAATARYEDTSGVLPFPYPYMLEDVTPEINPPLGVVKRVVGEAVEIAVAGGEGVIGGLEPGRGDVRRVEGYRVGQMVQLREGVVPLYGWAYISELVEVWDAAKRKGRKRVNAARVATVHPNGFLTVHLPGELWHSSRHWLVQPEHVQPVGLRSCKGLQNKWELLGAVHWSLQPLSFISSLFVMYIASRSISIPFMPDLLQSAKENASDSADAADQSNGQVPRGGATPRYAARGGPTSPLQLFGWGGRKEKDGAEDNGSSGGGLSSRSEQGSRSNASTPAPGGGGGSRAGGSRAGGGDSSKAGSTRGGSFSAASGGGGGDSGRAGDGSLGNIAVPYGEGNGGWNPFAPKPEPTWLPSPLARMLPEAVGGRRRRDGQ
ncbi:unnamed protein product [Closterium sp. Naga37s-1]|nr:unnamed protein product [Closterium sp. Naga37s-1]